MNANNLNEQVSVIILCGGQGSRMDHINKGLLITQQKSFIEIVIGKIKPYLNNILISANEDLEFYSQFGYPVISDKQSGFQGPLAGLISCSGEIKTELTLTLPVDAPFFPESLPQIMYKSYISHPEICVAHDGIRPQFLFLLFETALFSSMETFFQQGGRSVNRWLSQNKNHYVYFSDNPEAFLNVNTPEDLLLLEKLNNG